jgi:E3 ubiquitin-protein ligase UBR1
MPSYDLELTHCYRDCALDDSCVMCSRCFHASSHTGHNISFFIAQQSGGSCDCGDLEAWRDPIDCPHHPPAPASTSAGISHDMDNAPAHNNDPPISGGHKLSSAASHATLKQASSKSTTSSSSSNHPLPKPIANYPNRRPLPSDLSHSLHATIAIALDFLLSTLDASPDDTGVPHSDADVRTQPTSDPLTREMWTVLIWNDDKHSFDELARLVAETTGRTREEGMAFAMSVDEHGRDVVEMGADLRKCMDTAAAFVQVDMGVTVRRAHDTFREHMGTVIVEWLLDLTRARFASDTLVLREVLATEFLSPRKKDATTAAANAAAAALRAHSKVTPDDPNAARLDWMFMYHTKLWKKPRLNLKEMYASIISLGSEHKLAVGGLTSPHFFSAGSLIALHITHYNGV